MLIDTKNFVKFQQGGLSKGVGHKKEKKALGKKACSWGRGPSRLAGFAGEGVFIKNLL